MEHQAEIETLEKSAQDNQQPISDAQPEHTQQDPTEQYDPNDLNKERFDYIVLGSGLTENILGAYGGSILNFNFEHYLEYSMLSFPELQSLVQQQLDCLKSKEKDLQFAEPQPPYHSFKVVHSFEKERLFSNENDYRRFSRQFNIDLQPKQFLIQNFRILFSKSVSVSELIRSGVSNYLEFQNVTDNYFYEAADKKIEANDSKNFHKIPFSKSEVFSNTFLSFKEKRQLVKVIEACLAGYDKLSEQEITQAKINSTHVYEKEFEMDEKEWNQVKEVRDQPVKVFLQEKMGIEKRMQDILLYAIGNVNENQFHQSQIHLENITTFGFFERIQKYLRSIGYYGDSPFLLCNYGSSEYSQAFSRIGSLHNNIYIVNNDLKVQKPVFDENKQFQNITISFSKDNPLNNFKDDTPIKAHKGLIVGPEYQSWLLNQAQIEDQTKTVASMIRLTIVANRPLCEEHSGLATILIPPETTGFYNRSPIRVYQQNDYTQATPRNYYLIMASMAIEPGSHNSDENLKPFQSFLKLFYHYEWDLTVSKEVIRKEEEIKSSDIQQDSSNSLPQESQSTEQQTSQSDLNEEEKTKEPEEATKKPEPSHPNIIFAVIYTQDYRSQYVGEAFQNVKFIKDTPFDSDIDQSFYEAQDLYYKQLKIENMKFLQRSETEEKMYNDMMNNEYDDESDEDNLINTLEQKMVNSNQNSDNVQNNVQEPTLQNSEANEQEQKKKDDNQLLDDLLDDLIN